MAAGVESKRLPTCVWIRALSGWSMLCEMESNDPGKRASAR